MEERESEKIRGERTNGRAGGTESRRQKREFSNTNEVQIITKAFITI